MKNYSQKKLTERTIEEVGTCKLSQLTKGVFLKIKENANDVYTFAGKDRTHGYVLQAESDINKQRYVKNDIIVVVGFTY